MKGRDWVFAFAVCALLSLLYFGAFSWLLNAWLSDRYYSHGFLIPPIAIFLIWRALKSKPAQGRMPIAGIALLCTGALMYVLGYAAQYQFAMALSIVPVLSGLALMLSEKGRHLLFPIHLLLTAIPLPWTANFGIFLQKPSVYGSFWIVKLFKPDTLLQYPSIIVNGSSFNVELACSGLSGAIALFTIAIIIAYFMRAPLWKKTAICALSVPFAVAANILRIALTVGVGVWFSPQVAEGFFHYASDLVLFIVALLLLVASSKVMKCLNFERIIP
ncbi:MAG: exosortase/archaeosortase family protein [Candidatus Thermoplasmatota archaeon]|nr:exosortase/archaeosortase family protein [Candidatus Thermoplasmatota archaeon]